MSNVFCICSDVFSLFGVFGETIALQVFFYFINKLFHKKP